MRCLNCYKKGLPLSTQTCPQCGVHLPSLMRDVLPHGTMLWSGTYCLDYALGRGGFGITYQAIHTALEKQVAIKEFYPYEHALREGKSGGLMIPTAKQEIYNRGKERFLREGKTLAKLNHPNVVRVENFFEERGTAYLVMELVTGNTLREELDAQPNKRFSPTQTETIVSALVEALETVHQQGIFHLDLKPDNILKTSEGRLVLVDFGASRQGLSSGTTSQAFTLDYAPPEVIAGRDFGAASDLFELGMMLHEMLTGKLPPRSLDRIFKDMWMPNVPEPWQTLLTSALRLPKEERPQSVLQWWHSNRASVSNDINQILQLQKPTVKTQPNTLTQICKACTTLNAYSNRFCQNCGTVLQSVPVEELPLKEKVEELHTDSSTQNKEASWGLELTAKLLICKACTTPNSHINRFCQKCGTALPSVTLQKLPPEKVQELHPDDWSRQKKGGFWGFIGSLLDDR